MRSATKLRTISFEIGLKGPSREVAEQSFEWRFFNHTVTGQNAHRAVGGAHRGLACRELRHGGLDRAVAAERLQPGGLGGDQADLLKLDGNVGERMLHRLKGTNRAAKRVAVAGVLQRLFEHRRGDADVHRRAQNAFLIQRAK